MGAKFVIGLTDLDSESFLYFPSTQINDLPSWNIPLNLKSSLVYILQANNAQIEKSTIEWQLDTSLPAVNNLIYLVNAIKEHSVYITEIRYNEFDQVDNLIDYEHIVDMKSITPVPGLTFPEYTSVDYNSVSTNSIPLYCSLELDGDKACMAANLQENETLFYAMRAGDMSSLKPGPVTRVVYPAFRMNFQSYVETVPDTEMSAEQLEWMQNNRELLESKGYFSSDVRNKIGSLVIGQLIGSDSEALDKIYRYNKICRIEIVEE